MPVAIVLLHATPLPDGRTIGRVQGWREGQRQEEKSHRAPALLAHVPAESPADSWSGAVERALDFSALAQAVLRRCAPALAVGGGQP